MKSWFKSIKKLKIGILDRYIIGKFLGTYLFTILMLVIIIVVFDVVEKMDDFLELNAPLMDVAFKYYLNFVPFFINQFSGLITFIAVIMFTSKMAYDTEIIAMLSGGVSFKRLVWPYFISAFIVTAMSLALNMYIIPRTNVTRLDFEAKYLKKNKRDNFESFIYRQVSPGTFISLKGYNSITKSASFLVLETYDGGKIVSSLSAKDAKFDESSLHWRAPRYLTRTYEGDVETLVKYDSQLDTMVNLTSSELGKVENFIQTLTIDELIDFIDEQKQKGSDMIDTFEVDKYNRFAYPFSTFILTLIGLSLSSRKVRGGTGLHIGIGIGLCFSYIMAMQLTNEFAKAGDMPTMIAVWLPNIIFTFVSIYLYNKAPK
ncbi:MAG: LptF/LptG family permease [Rikenellaceae bacterium]